MTTQELEKVNRPLQYIQNGYDSMCNIHIGGRDALVLVLYSLIIILLQEPQ